VNPTKWFGIIVLYTFLTLFCVYLIPNESAFSIFTYFFGFTFVTAIPGYCLISFLFREGTLDVVEKGVLSFSIAGVSGLFLGLSPIGITVSSITVSLSTIVLILALLAVMRKMQLLPKLRKTSSVKINP
jgi:uncharacterized membrane protein